MRKIIVILSFSLASLLTLPVTAHENHSTAAERKTLGKKPDAAMEAPLSAGYETAIEAHQAKAYFRQAGTSPALYGPGDIYSLLVTGKESNNVIFQFEAIVPEGGGPPPHVHSREDETFYIVSGSLEVLVGDVTYHAQKGDFVYVPRGAIHAFKNTEGGEAVQLVTFSPAGMEGFFQEVFPTVRDRQAAPPPITKQLIQKMNKAAPKYGMEYTVSDDNEH